MAAANRFVFIIWKSFAAVRFWNSIGDDEILSDMNTASFMYRGWFDVVRACFLSKGLVSRTKNVVRGLVGDEFVVKTCRANMNQSVHECLPVGGGPAHSHVDALQDKLLKPTQIGLDHYIRHRQEGRVLRIHVWTRRRNG